MSPFVDTSGVLAVMDADDPYHTVAAEAWRRLVGNGATLVTHNYAAVATTAILHDRAGIAAVRRFVDDILPVVGIHWVTREEHMAAVHALTAGGRRGPSLVDCVSLAVIAAAGCTQVLASDHHFAERGYGSAAG